MTNDRTFAPSIMVDPQRVRETKEPVETYEGRSGYNPKFVDNTKLSLPRWPGRSRDIAPVLAAARRPDDAAGELRYEHFSVVVSKSRRLPVFSAVNIDGGKSVRKVPRGDVWLRDPRIDDQYQILRECYGEQQKGMFSRGHMTRREDPNWGSPTVVKRANADTFHATNAAPQAQKFNGGVWLGSEDYVLDNTDQDDMKVTVITGPVFAENDPEYFGVKVPVSFFKVLIFVHDTTKQLTAIGYRRSQAAFLPDLVRPRHVFGDYDDTQVSLSNIAQATGLDFGPMADLDVMKGAGPDLAVRLTRVDDLFLA